MHVHPVEQKWSPPEFRINLVNIKKKALNSSKFGEGHGIERSETRLKI